MSSKSFIVLLFTCKFIIILNIYCEVGGQILFHLLFVIPRLPWVCSVAFVKNQVWCSDGSVSGLFSATGLLVSLSPGPAHVGYCSFVMSLGTRWARPHTLFFFFVSWLFLSPLQFHVSFRSVCQVLQKILVRFSLGMHWIYRTFREEFKSLEYWVVQSLGLLKFLTNMW